MAIAHGFAGFAFPCLIAAAIFSAIGFATDNWVRVQVGSHIASSGLWTGCSEVMDLTKIKEGWFNATQAMMTIGLILLICSLILLFLYLFVQSLSSKRIMTVFTVLAFATVLFMVIGQIIYRVKMDKGPKMHWSYGMSVTGAVLCLVSAILAVVHLKQPESSSYSNLG